MFRSMMRVFMVLIVLGCLPAFPADALPVSVARHALDLLLAEKYTDLRAMFTPQMREALSEEALKNQVGPKIKDFGKLLKVGTPDMRKVKAFDVVVLPCTFANANINFQIALDQNGKIAGLYFRPGAGAGG